MTDEPTSREAGTADVASCTWWLGAAPDALEQLTEQELARRVFQSGGACPWEDQHA